MLKDRSAKNTTGYFNSSTKHHKKGAPNKKGEKLRVETITLSGIGKKGK